MASTVEVVEPEQLLITPELYRRQPRGDDLAAELQAHRDLSMLMTVDADATIQRFLELAIELCPAAGSAGFSELETDENGNPVFRWTALAGDYAGHVGGCTPRDLSPCGLCLDQQHTILVERPARAFDYFNNAEPPIVEGLIVPLFDTGKRAIGTLWVVSHEEGVQFCPTDARVMEQLAVQLVLAIKLRRKATSLVQLEEAVRDKDVLVHEVRHRVKNMIQMASGLLQLQQRGLEAGEAQSALREAESRLLVLASVYEGLLEPDADVRQVEAGNLVKTLAAALCDGRRRPRITLRSQCDHLFVGVSHAVSLGLIVNEAVTNALKHGFPTDREGRIVVRLRSDGDRSHLTIEDDGLGFEEPLRDGSLGIRLMRNLARQLRGKLSIDGSSGTKVRLEWENMEPALEVQPQGQLRPGLAPA